MKITLPRDSKNTKHPKNKQYRKSQWFDSIGLWPWRQAHGRSSGPSITLRARSSRLLWRRRPTPRARRSGFRAGPITSTCTRAASVVSWRCAWACGVPRWTGCARATYGRADARGRVRRTHCHPCPTLRQQTPPTFKRATSRVCTCLHPLPSKVEEAVDGFSLALARADGRCTHRRSRACRAQRH